MEQKEQSTFDRKQKIKEAIERKKRKQNRPLIKALTIIYIYIEGKTLPTELRKMDKGSKEDFGYDQAQEGKHTHNYEKEHSY